MKNILGLIGGFGVKAISTLLGPRVLIGAFLTLFSALVVMWWQLDSAKAASANANLNNKNLGQVIEENDRTIKILEKERKDLERLLIARSAERSSSMSRVAKLKKEIENVKNDKCLDTFVPDDFASILRDN